VKLDDSFGEEALREIFDSIDADNDGELDVQEFGNAMLQTLKAE
jgi:Ca2+-binding EF-hand superfamily protein